jgi:hypothetical protein
MQTQSTRAISEPGFRCAAPDCGQYVGDRQYVGPIGHAPQNLCFECWLAHWDKIEARAVNGGRWTHLDEALWLVCRGLSLTQAADIVAGPSRMLGRWIAEMRRRPELTPDWLIHINELRRQRRDPQI